MPAAEPEPAWVFGPPPAWQPAAAYRPGRAPGPEPAPEPAGLGGSPGPVAGVTRADSETRPGTDPSSTISALLDWLADDRPPPLAEMPADPAGAAKPPDPAAPAELAKPAEAADLATPPDLAEPADLADPAKLAESPDLAEPPYPAEPAKPADPAKLAKPPDLAKLSDLAKPPDLAKPADLADPAKLAEPPDLAEPAEPPYPAYLAELAEPARPPDPGEPAHLAEPAGPPGPAEPVDPDGLPARLVTLGLPAGLAGLARDQDRYSAVLQAVSTLPPPPAPPARPGDVLVLVGEPVPATVMAGQLAELMRLDPARTLIATPNTAPVPGARRVLSVLEADRKARRMHIGDLPHLVVVDAPVAGHDPVWTGAMVEALRPTAVWAVVDATRKPADLARYLQSLGTVDALAVHATGFSGDPATVLRLGVPVAWLDGRPANAGTWAALLCDRLAGG
ncbi:MAG TPA: hypothetical protein VMU51_28685 [Mycobacteriales bacterium]|nr:hypothetical protein [Mycobacteriales bacterium]